MNSKNIKEGDLVRFRAKEFGKHEKVETLYGTVVEQYAGEKFKILSNGEYYIVKLRDIASR